MPGGNLNAGICALHSGGDADAGAAEVIQGEVVLADHHQACLLYTSNADAVPQLPERCLSRKAGIVRCCPKPYC